MFSDTSLKETLDMERFANNIASFFWTYWSCCHAKLYFYGTAQQQSALNIFGLLILFFIASSINVSAVNASIDIEMRVWVRVSKEANRYRVSTLLKGLIRQLNYMLILF